MVLNQNKRKIVFSKHKKNLKDKWNKEQVSFGLRKNEVLSLLGVNGSGKSTIYRLIVK